MSETNAQEPTMEEILASIRRIISEDDAPSPEAAPEPNAAAPSAAAPKAAAPEPAPQPKVVAPEPTPSPSPQEDDVLELTEPMPPAVAAPPEPAKPHAYEQPLAEPDVFSTSAPEFPPAFRPAPEPAANFAEEPLVGSYAAEASASHFGALARSVAMPKEGRTLEDLVREMLKPMLRDWLDHNLSPIVEARVQAEVERISRLKEF